MDGNSPHSLEDMCQLLQKSVKDAIMASNSIPSSEFSYFLSFSGFSKIMQHDSKVTLNLMGSLIKCLNTGSKQIEKAKEIEDRFDVLCDVNDVLLDRVNHSLDEAAGLKEKDQELIVATLKVSHLNDNKEIKGIKRKRDEVYNLLSAKNIHRPQSKFKDKIDNRSLPFVPIIKEKPNSIRPLAIYAELNEDGAESFCHPYETELEKFEPKDSFLTKPTPIMPKALEETPFKLIDTKEDLEALLKKLSEVSEFAVDLEHHSYRSFQGFTCLMQISTRDEDFIIDAISLRSEMYILNEVFTKPSIVKVFHGADMDILWLQRDFGIYVVNMFDTGQGAKMLNFAHYSLAYLLKHYCDIEANKRYQLADWRIRPLNDDMIKYAREDTHFLLYIYDSMKKALLESEKVGNNKSFCKKVFERSKQVCLKKYERPQFNEMGFMSLLNRSKAHLNARQMYALKEIYSWRDKIARIEDESLSYILPNHMMLQIADVLPREQQGILACCNPIPPMIKQQLNELHQIIIKARNLPIENKVNPITLQAKSGLTSKIVDYDNVVHCRHDILYKGEGGHRNTLCSDGKGDDINWDRLTEKTQEKHRDNCHLANLFEGGRIRGTISWNNCKKIAMDFKKS